VDPRFGIWEDVDKIGRAFDLIIDFMVNYISRQSDFFQDYLAKGVNKHSNLTHLEERSASNGDPVRMSQSPGGKGFCYREDGLTACRSRVKFGRRSTPHPLEILLILNLTSPALLIQCFKRIMVRIVNKAIDIIVIH
jgi:hypothetical protein